MSSRDDEGTSANTVAEVAVDLGAARVDVFERHSLERVTEGKSDLW